MPSKHISTQSLEQDIIATRRQRVSSLRNRGLTHIEIWQQMSMPMIGDKSNPSYLVNPKTGKPFDRTTITRDLQWLREDNHRQAAADISEHQSRQFSELQELKRFAWSTKDGKLALSVLDKEMKLLGTMRQPDGINVNLLVVVQRLEQVTRELGVEPSAALNEFVEMLHAQRQASG
jgi:hypothetical protein